MNSLATSKLAKLGAKGVVTTGVGLVCHLAFMNSSGNTPKVRYRSQSGSAFGDGVGGKINFSFLADDVQLPRASCAASFSS